MAGIVVADGDDAQAVHDVMLAAFTPYRSEYTDGCFDATVLDATRVRQRMAEGPVFVALDGSDVVGTVGVMLDDRGAYVRGLAVHPDAQGAGVARRLMEACEAWGRHQGAKAIWLSTTLFLAPSIALYKRLGYQDAPGPDDLFGTALRSFEKPL